MKNMSAQEQPRRSDLQFATVLLQKFLHSIILCLMIHSPILACLIKKREYGGAVEQMLLNIRMSQYCPFCTFDISTTLSDEIKYAVVLLRTAIQCDKM